MSHSFHFVFMRFVVILSEENQQKTLYYFEKNNTINIRKLFLFVIVKINIVKYFQ